MGKFSIEEEKKFNKIKKLVLDVVDVMDNDKGLNKKKYVELFNEFEKNPDEFRKWNVLTDDSIDSSIQLNYLPFEEPSMPQIKEAADILKCPLEEYIYYRMNGDKEGIRSKIRCPVGYVTIKRVQQILSKKNHYAFDTEKRSIKTGEVRGEHSKVAAMSDTESMYLQVINADSAIEELHGPRGGNLEKKNIMYKSIARYGYATLRDTREAKTPSEAVKTMDTYLLASGIKSDLISNVKTLKTYFTMDQELTGNM